jgi:hypothetical protein
MPDPTPNDSLFNDSDAVQKKVLEFIDAAQERQAMFSGLAYQNGPMHEDAQDVAMATLMNYAAAQTLILADIGRSFAQLVEASQPPIPTTIPTGEVD